MYCVGKLYLNTVRFGTAMDLLFMLNMLNTCSMYGVTNTHRLHLFSYVLLLCGLLQYIFHI